MVPLQDKLCNALGLRCRYKQMFYNDALKFIKKYTDAIFSKFFSKYSIKMPTTRESLARRKLTGFKRHKPALPYGKRRSGFMKKTTRRGAYAKGAKRNMMVRRAPFVETKSKTQEDLVVQFPGLTDTAVFRTYNSELVPMNPETFFMWKQGLNENECIGNSVFAKYLKMKIGIRFPQPAFTSGAYNKKIPMTPQNYELVWGWIPNELGHTGQTSPKAPETSINDITSFINQRVRDYFDEQKDKMRFIPKRASTIRIVGRRKIRPDLRHMSTAPPQTTDALASDDYAVGTIPDRYTSISWKMNKKLHLQPTAKLWSTGTYPNEVFYEGLYAGNFGTWLPFAVLVNWDYANLPGGGGDSTQAYCPSLQFNDAIWYSDS